MSFWIRMLQFIKCLIAIKMILIWRVIYGDFRCENSLKLEIDGLFIDGYTVTHSEWPFIGTGLLDVQQKSNSAKTSLMMTDDMKGSGNVTIDESTLPKNQTAKKLYKVAPENLIPLNASKDELWMDASPLKIIFTFYIEKIQSLSFI